MATTATVHAHAAPQGFIRKYIFSLDHKIIGLQYYFLALVAVFVGMFLSLLMRIHLIWPTAVLPLVGEIKPEDRKSTRLNSSHSPISYAAFCLKKQNATHG